MKYLPYLILFILGGALGFYINPKPKPIILDPIILTNTDTIYKKINVLQLKQDTLKIYYEEKIYIYNSLATNERVELFADRINR